MTDKLSQYLVTITTQSLTEDFENLQKWLVQMSKEFSADTLLAHADDGVIWGKVVDSELITSHDALLESDNPLYSPPLRQETLQQARLFGKNSEIMLWKDNASGIWQIRTLEEVVEGEILEAYDEAYILWGTDVQSLPNGFSLLIDGSEGLQHVPPIEIKATGRVRPLRLIVRHYLGEQENGFNYVRCSRLVGLTTRGGQ